MSDRVALANGRYTEGISQFLTLLYGTPTSSDCFLLLFGCSRVCIANPDDNALLPDSPSDIRLLGPAIA